MRQKEKFDPSRFEDRTKLAKLLLDKAIELEFVD